MKVYVITCEKRGYETTQDTEILGVYTDLMQARQRLDDCFDESYEHLGLKELNECCERDNTHFHIKDALGNFIINGDIIVQDLITDDFPVTTVCRDDLENIGFDTANVDDSTMEQLASKMSNAYCDSEFWIDLPICAEALDIPRKEE